MPVVPPPTTQKDAEATALKTPPPNYTPPGSPLQTAAPPPLNRNMPMKGLPAILRSSSVAEAQARRNDWHPPHIIPGEPVYYRRKGGNDEELAFVMKQLNKSFTLMIAANNNVWKEIGSVDYFDHTDPGEGTSTGDPMAGHHSYGTFRRTPFGKMIIDIVARTTGGLTGETNAAPQQSDLKTITDKVSTVLEGMAAEIQDMRAGIDMVRNEAKAEIDKLTALVTSLTEPTKPQAQKPAPPAPPKAPKEPEAAK